MTFKLSKERCRGNIVDPCLDRKTGALRIQTNGNIGKILKLTGFQENHY